MLTNFASFTQFPDKLLCHCHRDTFIIITLTTDYCTKGGRYGFGCSELEGNACADYGIVVTVVDEEGDTIDTVDNVCEDGVVHEGALLPGHSIMVGVWFTPRDPIQ